MMIEIFAPLMFAGLILIMLIGFPVAFSLSALGLLCGFIAIQITLNEGRSVEMKKAFFRRVAERLQQELGVRPQDVLVSLVEVKKENWSFGNGVAQYAA